MKVLFYPMILVLLISCKSDIFQNANYEIQKKRHSASKNDIELSKKAFLVGKDLYRNKKDLISSINKFHEAIKYYPDPDYYYELGNCYIDYKDYDKALLSYRIAIDLNYKNLANIYYNASCAASLNNQSDLSLKYLEKALLNNYPNISHIKQDNDLLNIKNDQRFKDLISRYDVLVSFIERNYIGIWQFNAPIMASGWTDTYIFFPDRKYILYYNQMNCSKRIISEHGYWKINNNKLILNKNNIALIEGGKLIPVMGGSCGSKETLVDGKIVKNIIDPPEIVEYNVSNIFIRNFSMSDSSGDKLSKKVFKLDNDEYYFYGDNPDFYK